MHECRRLQRLPLLPLLRHARRRQPPQFLINQRQQIFGRTGARLAPAACNNKVTSLTGMDMGYPTNISAPVAIFFGAGADDDR